MLSRTGKTFREFHFLVEKEQITQRSVASKTDSQRLFVGVSISEGEHRRLKLLSKINI